MFGSPYHSSISFCKKLVTLFQDLVDTVGIHPTCLEEIVALNVKKSSGEDASAGGC